MRKVSLLTLCLLFSSIVSMRAQDTTAAATEDEGKFSVTGYLDNYYLHSFNNPGSGQLLGRSAGRAFDRLTDQFALGLVQTKFGYSNKKSDMVIDLTFGPNAELGNFGNQLAGATGFSPASGNQAVLYGSSIAIKQAYWTYKATSKFSFTIGQFGTHIGYEVIDAPVNFHYSLSNLFNNGPFYHVGAKANYAFSDNFGLMLGIVNNWDALTDWKTQKTGIAQLFIKPIDGWNIYLNWVGGTNDDPYKVRGGRVGNNNTFNAPLFGGISYNRNLFDITTGYQITDDFYLGLNAAYGFYSGDKSFQDSSKVRTKEKSGNEKSMLPWYGIAGYANYTLTDYLAVGARFEHFSDKYEVRYLGATNNSLTITAPITLAAGHLIIKPEFRLDTSPSMWGMSSVNGVDKPTYYYEKGEDGETTKTQSTIGCAFIYKY